MKHSPLRNIGSILLKHDFLGEQISSTPGVVEGATVGPQAGILTARKLVNAKRKQYESPERRIRHEIELDPFPEFAGCPDWIKPIMYREYQVTYSIQSGCMADCFLMYFLTRLAGGILRGLALLYFRKPHRGSVRGAARRLAFRNDRAQASHAAGGAVQLQPHARLHAPTRTTRRGARSSFRLAASAVMHSESQHSK